MNHNEKSGSNGVVSEKARMIELIKELRRMGMTIKQIARRLKLSESRIIEIENQYLHEMSEENLKEAP
jgi:transcriptional regulator with XRE-family HTH domain